MIHEVDVDINISVSRPDARSLRAEQKDLPTGSCWLDVKNREREEEVWFERGRAVISLVTEANRGRSPDQNQRSEQDEKMGLKKKHLQILTGI